ncbi:hypothetical protein LRP88_13017 [Fusarium phalaenopsidis]
MAPNTGSPSTPRSKLPVTPQQGQPATKPEEPNIPMDTDDDGEEHIVPASHEDEVRKLRNKYNHLSIQHNNLLDGARNNARITQERLASMEASMNDMQERFRQAMEQQQQQYQQTINEQQNRIDRLTTLQAQQNDLAQQQVHDLGNLTFEHTAAGTTHKDIGEIIKPKDPEPFNGQATHVRTFLTSLRAYQRYFPTRMASAESKVLHASRCLTGNALTWFEPKLRDFLGNEPTEETQLLFAEYENFEEAIRRNFGTIDEEQQATQKLKNLRQTKAASTYAAEFTQITSFLNWGTSALQIAFYEGLKDEVKDELCKTEKPDNLQDYIDMTIKIDNRQFERRMEKSNKGRIWGNKNNANQSRRREQTRGNTSYGTHAGPMELGAAQKDSKDIECYYCHKKGHKANECRKKQRDTEEGRYQPRPRQPLPEGKKQVRSTWADTEPQTAIRTVRTLGMARQGYDKTGIQPDELDMPHSQVYLSEKQAEGNYMINNITKERLHEPVKPQKNNRSHITEHVGWKPLPEPNKGRQQPGNLMSQRTIAVTRRAEPKIEEPTTPPSAQQPSNEQADFQEAAAEGFDHKKWIVGYEEKEQLLVPATVHRRDCRQDDPTRCNHTLCPRHQIEASREYDEICERQKQTNTADCHAMIGLPRQAVATSIEPSSSTRLDNYRENYARSALGSPGKATKNYGRRKTTPNLVHWYESIGVANARYSSKLYHATQEKKRITHKIEDWQKTISQENEEDPGAEQERQYQDWLHKKDDTHDYDACANSELDSGAEQNYFDPTTANRLRLPWRYKQTPYSVVNLEGTPFDYNNGIIDSEIDHLKVFVEGKNQGISFDLHKKKPQDNPEEEERLKNIPWQYRIYKKLFAEELETGLPEHTHYDLEIEFIDGKQPGFSKLYPLNEAQLPVLKEYIEDMIRKGYIRESKSSVGYPVMFVPEEKRKAPALCRLQDAQRHYGQGSHTATSHQRIEGSAFGMKYFTALDLKGAYNLIRIKEGHEWKTAFRTKYGLFEYLVMPFGLTNAPAAFQRMINNVLREHLDIFVVCYLDDILIFSKTEEEHTEHVHKQIPRPGSGIPRHIISHNEIRMDPKKVSAVKEWEEPTNVKEVQAFLGFANYYRKFLKAFGRIAAPLTELTKKDKTFVFGNKAKDAFDKIKELILSEPVLKMFDPSQPIELETDASDFALGAQIGQRDDKGLLHPIAFYSHKLHGAELNYPIYDKEFLAIVNAFKEFRHYLLGSQHQIKVYTDHKNITHFAKTQELSGRQLRYAEYLSEFDYVIIHVKGTENGRADAISRRPDLDTGRTKTKEQLLQNYNTTSYAKYTNTCYTDTKESIKP